MRALCGQDEIGTQKDSIRREPGPIGNVGHRVLGPSAECWPGAPVRGADSPPAYKARSSGVTKQEFQPQNIHKLQTGREVGMCIFSSQLCSSGDRLSCIVNIKIDIARGEPLL